MKSHIDKMRESKYFGFLMLNIILTIKYEVNSEKYKNTLGLAEYLKILHFSKSKTIYIIISLIIPV